MKEHKESHQPRKPTITERECLKCEKTVKLKDDMRICPACTTNNLQNSSGYGNTGIAMPCSSNGRRRAMS
jgi:hypothetical protein